MPFKSRRQQKYMFSQHKDIAEKWRKEGKAYVKPEKKKAKKRKK